MILKASTENIELAASLLKKGEVVSFPTETVYGLGADATSDNAVEKIFKLKGRPSSNPLIVHLADSDKAKELLSIEVDLLIQARFARISTLWPGPLSVIIPKPAHISKLVSAGGDTIAIRVPNHPVASEILNTVNIPIAAPSANKSFAVSPTIAIHVDESFSSDNITIIDGGECKVGLESTVVDITSTIPTILRPGSITISEIENTLKETCIKSDEKNSEIVKSPGLTDLHYAPNTPLIFLEDLKVSSNPATTGIIMFTSKKIDLYAKQANNMVILSECGDLNEVAQKLYREIRLMDKLNLNLIAIDSCEEKGIGLAIMDRLKRATAGSRK